MGRETFWLVGLMRLRLCMRHVLILGRGTVYVDHIHSLERKRLFNMTTYLYENEAV